MGFKGVHRSLMELFPQVDPRILKAVAIEHPKSADSAAEVVISEVLPHLATQSTGVNPLHENCSSSSFASGQAEHQHTNSLGCQQVDSEEAANTFVESRLISTEDACKDTMAVHSSDSAYQEQSQNSTAVLSSDRTVDSNHLQGNIEREELILLKKPQNQEGSSQFSISQASEVTSCVLSCKETTEPCQLCTTTEAEILVSPGKIQDSNIKIEHGRTSQVKSTGLEPERGDYIGSLTSHYSEWKEFDGPSDEFDKFPNGGSTETNLCSDGADMEVKNSVVEEMPNAVEFDLQSEFSGTSIDSCKNSKCSQEIKIDILEGIVEAAKNHKKTLFLEVDSIMNKMREVELKEKIAEQAKEEAASAGMETLAKVEELKKMLARAKEANDMHAGEVYGEKSILVTEVRELQVRLLSLSDERDQALGILDEMHQTLGERLAAAEEVKKTAEKQKLEKEEVAQNALSEQEAMMKKVVQESKILQHEAEENAKLREFLMDRGRVVDALQGEISIICHDVRLLKERFDERLPLSKSISSSQPSCILASSGSSLRSMGSDLVLEPREAFMSPNKERSPSSSINGQSPKRSPTSSINGQSPDSGKEKRTVSEEKAGKINFEEEEWDFLE